MKNLSGPYTEWPLLTTLSREGLEELGRALEFWLTRHTASTELWNTLNLIRSYLQRPREAGPTDEELLS